MVLIDRFRLPALGAALLLSFFTVGCESDEVNVTDGGADAGTDMGIVDSGTDMGTPPPPVFVGASASTHLHSSADGIDFVVFGSLDPLQVVPAGNPRPFLYGKMMTDASTSIQYGTYELDGTGNGQIHITTAFNMPNESALAVTARDGTTRTDFDMAYDFPLVVAASGAGTSITIDGNAHVYTKFDDVVAAIDPAGATGFYDTYMLYNFALTLTQARVPGFGGLGMTQYIGPGTSFQALTSGTYSVGVQSLFTPTATIAYTAAEDTPGVYFDGAMVTMSNLMGNGPMSGVISFEFRATANRATVLLAGSVDYSMISVMNANAASGNYVVSIAGQPATQQLPYTVAATRDLTNILPVTP